MAIGGVRVLVLSLAFIVTVTGVAYSATQWTLEDMDAYWNAAMRLRSGAPLYPDNPDDTVATVYRYAPWFAYVWWPLTYLPKTAVAIGWSVVLLCATAAALWPVVRRPTPASVSAAAILGPLLLSIAAVGNVQPIVVAGLVFGLERRSGPAWIAMAASLKAVPFLFVVVYAARHEWGRMAAAIVITTMLVGHMLLFDLSNYPADPGQLTISLYNRLPVVWAATAVAAVTLTCMLAGRRSPFTWLAASVSVIAALPRTFGYDFTFVIAALAQRPDRST